MARVGDRLIDGLSASTGDRDLTNLLVPATLTNAGAGGDAGGGAASFLFVDGAFARSFNQLR